MTQPGKIHLWAPLFDAGCDTRMISNVGLARVGYFVFSYLFHDATTRHLLCLRCVKSFKAAERAKRGQ